MSENNGTKEEATAGSGLSDGLGGDWWMDPEHEIIDLENTEAGIKTLYARLVDDSWEYAVVCWQYHHPNLQMIIKDGKCFQD